MGSRDIELMADLTSDELASNRGTRLPDKQALSVVPLIDTGSLLDGGPLLNLNLDLDLDADIAAPIDAAIAANANVAIPIDAAVSATRTRCSRSTCVAPRWRRPIRTSPSIRAATTSKRPIPYPPTQKLPWLLVRCSI